MTVIKFTICQAAMASEESERQDYCKYARSQLPRHAMMMMER